MSILLRACLLSSAIVASLPLQAADAMLDKRTIANDTLDKVKAKALDQQAAAYRRRMTGD